MKADKDSFLNALAKAAYRVSVEKFELTSDIDSPIYPESLVQVVVGQVLKEEFAISADKSPIDRPGFLDLVCWDSQKPLAVIEVKDQLTGTDDGIVNDICRIQRLLSMRHFFFF